MDLGDLVTRLPSTVRCVVSTRRDPPWTLRRLRLDGRLVELRGTDLAFQEGEARQLLAAVSERDLNDHDVEVLTERTDGWAVGLQLAGISLRHQPDVTAAITSFAGSDRLIAEFLLDEVLEQLEPDIRTFLLQTSVLDWLSVDLCDAVTGAGNARAMLAELEDRSLFVIPLDMSRTNFRYHHLFAELLRYQLKAEDASAARSLHGRAARWLLEHGRAEESIEHLLRAGEHDQAFAEISRLGHRFFERGESATLVRWLTTIKGDDSTAPARVVISLLAAQIAADLPDAAAETYRQLVRRPDLTAGERATADALHTTQVFRSLPPEAVVTTARSVLDVLPSLEDRDVVDFLGMGGTESVRVMAEYDAAIACFLQGHLEQATVRLRRALVLPGAQYPIWRFYTARVTGPGPGLDRTLHRGPPARRRRPQWRPSDRRHPPPGRDPRPPGGGTGAPVPGRLRPRRGKPGHGRPAEPAAPVQRGQPGPAPSPGGSALPRRRETRRGRWRHCAARPPRPSNRPCSPTPTARCTRSC